MSYGSVFAKNLFAGKVILVTGGGSGIGRRHPAVGEVAVVRKEDAQRLVDAEQVADAVEEIAAVGERLAAAIAGERRAMGRRHAEQRGLLGGRDAPVAEERRDHPGEADAGIAAVGDGVVLRFGFGGVHGAISGEMSGT